MREAKRLGSITHEIRKIGNKGAPVADDLAAS